MMNYFSKHVWYTSIVHAIAGVGLGIIIARPIDASHPVKLGLILLTVATLGHIYPMTLKK